MPSHYVVFKYALHNGDVCFGVEQLSTALLVLSSEGMNINDFGKQLEISSD
jgi:hypothetical protein